MRCLSSQVTLSARHAAAIARLTLTDACGNAEGAPSMTNGGDTTHVAAANGGEGHGYWKNSNNFPGPKYGLPGYKESHKRETGPLQADAGP
jgi:hypothetical protein